jgi:hypothetical protein
MLNIFLSKCFSDTKNCITFLYTDLNKNLGKKYSTGLLDIVLYEKDSFINRYVFRDTA